jgi:hypothetical protein
LLHMAIQSLHLLQLLSLICVKTRIAMRSNGPQHKSTTGWEFRQFQLGVDAKVLYYFD